jgi:hypothetical protein
LIPQITVAAGDPGRVIHLDRLREEARVKVHPLLSKLPRTKQVVSLLHLTAQPRVHAV